MKVRSIVGLKNLFIVVVVHRPPIIVELNIKNFAIENVWNIDALLQNNGHIFKEQIAWNITVLEFSNKVYEGITAPHLIIFECYVYGICIVIVFIVSSQNFVFVNHWVVS